MMFQIHKDVDVVQRLEPTQGNERKTHRLILYHHDGKKKERMNVLDRGLSDG